jgi:hypothetical protein
MTGMPDPTRTAGATGATTTADAADAPTTEAAT